MLSTVYLSVFQPLRSVPPPLILPPNYADPPAISTLRSTHAFNQFGGQSFWEPPVHQALSWALGTPRSTTGVSRKSLYPARALPAFTTLHGHLCAHVLSLPGRSCASVCTRHCSWCSLWPEVHICPLDVSCSSRTAGADDPLFQVLSPSDAHSLSTGLPSLVKVQVANDTLFSLCLKNNKYLEQKKFRIIIPKCHLKQTHLGSNGDDTLSFKWTNNYKG